MGGKARLPTERPPALLRYLREIRREHRSIDPTRILDLLRRLYPEATYSPEGELLTWEWGYLGWVAKRQAHEGARRAGWTAIRARATRSARRLKSIEALVNRMEDGKRSRAPRTCSECGAQSPDQQALWCASTCPPERGDGKALKARILAELETARGWRPAGPLKPLVPARGEHSALAWVGPMATTIMGELQAVAPSLPGEKPIDHTRLTARILSVASGQRITRDMVRDRIERPAGNK